MIRWRLGIIFFQTVLPAANVGPAYLRCFIFGLRSCLLLNSRRELFVGFLPKLIIFAQFVLCPAYKWRCRKSQLKPKDFLWKRLEVTSLRKGSKSPFFRIGYLLKNISKQFNSFPKNRRSRSKNSYILFLLHLRPVCFRFYLYHVQGPKTFMRLLLWWIFNLFCFSPFHWQSCIQLLCYVVE